MRTHPGMRKDTEPCLFNSAVHVPYSCVNESFDIEIANQQNY